MATDINWKDIVFNVDEIKTWLEKRYKTKNVVNPENKTKQTDKHSSTFNALMKKIKYRTFGEILTNVDDILSTHYKTPSTIQSVLSMIRILAVEYAGMTDSYWKEHYGAKNASLKAEYLATTCANTKCLTGMTFQEAKTLVSDNPTISLYFKIYSGAMESLRFGDWLNSSTVDTGKNNYINLKEKTMTRRITKNAKGEMKIKIPMVIIKEIKKQNIQGDLFGALTEPQVSLLIKKTYPDKIANSRHFRTLYSTTKLIKLKSVEKLQHALLVMDHDLKTWLTTYQKMSSPLMKLFHMVKI